MDRYSSVSYRSLKDEEKFGRKRHRHFKPAVVILFVVVIALLCLAAYLISIKRDGKLQDVNPTPVQDFISQDGKGVHIADEESEGSVSAGRTVNHPGKSVTFNPPTGNTDEDAMELLRQEVDRQLEKQQLQEPKIPEIHKGDLEDNNVVKRRKMQEAAVTTPRPKVRKHKPNMDELRKELETIVSGLRHGEGNIKLLQKRLMSIQRALAYSEDKEMMEADKEFRPPPKFRESATTLEHPRIRAMIEALHDNPGLLDTYDFKSPLIWDYRCVFLQTHSYPNPLICIHDPIEGNPVSSSLAEFGVYETKMLNYYLMILRSDPSLEAVDLGAHVGVYSIAAAGIGRKVLAVEPNINNIYPFHKSVKMNRFGDLITLVTNCLSDKHKLVELIYSRRGDLSLTTTVDITPKLLKNDVIEPEDICRTVTLGDLGKAMVKRKAVVKIDVQGDEAALFRSSFAFFNNINVKYVLMHWYYSQNPSDYDFIFDILKNRNYKPNESPHGPTFNDNHLKSDHDVIVWIKF